MQYNEFADFLNIKEAALANKSSNKLTSSTSNHQLLGSSASKFKPIKSNKFNNNNGQYQSLSHQSNDSRSSNLNKSISKSNENLSFQSPFNRKTPNKQQQQQQQQSIRYNSNNNPFLKHFSKNENNQIDSDKIKQQSQFVQKMQFNEVADLLSIKESALASKQQQQQHHHQSTANKFISQNNYSNQQQASTPNTSKFKPINNNNSSKVSLTIYLI